MNIDSLMIKKVAHLARLKIQPAEADSLIKDLNRILTWVQQLDEVETDQVEPMFCIHQGQMRRRPDVLMDGNDQESILENAPEQELNLFSVPKVVE